MLRNFLLIALRNLWKNKGFSAINIAGLAVGMASAILILLWIESEVNVDRFHEKTNRIYMVFNRDNINGELQAINQTPFVMAPALKQNYPEVEDAVRFSNVTFLVTHNEKFLNIRGAFADSGFLSVFSFPLLEGNSAKVLSETNSIVLTESLAKKLFGNEPAMGKTVNVEKKDNFIVTGILKDLPLNTQFQFEFLVPQKYMTALGWDDNIWSNNFAQTYVLLKPGTSQAMFDKKIKNITIEHTKGSANESKAEVFTQSLSKLYLYSKSENGQLTGGRIQAVQQLSVLAFFILLIACINFMNLSTARSEKRAKEVGIRKVSGAYRGSLIVQFIGESILLSLFAFILAVVLVQVSLPGFNELTGKQLSIDFQLYYYWGFAALFILLTGIIAGSYPAFYLSAFSPVKVLKGHFRKMNALVTSRKALVVFQFTIAIILIVSTLIVTRQIQFAQNREAGYNRNNLLYTFNQGDIDKNYRLIREALLNSGTAVSVTRSVSPITRRWSGVSGFQWPGSTKEDERIDFARMGADAGFVKTTGVQLVAGRDIDVFQYPTDSTAMLLNEEAVKIMRLKNPVGTIIKRAGYPNDWHVVGVVKNFILESPFENINPMLIVGPRDWGYITHFRLNPNLPVTEAIAGAEKIFKEYNPGFPFEYVFTDESYAKKFEETQRTGNLAGLFAGLTIFISCLGLLGLATYMAEERKKEIGIRKTLGASSMVITVLLSKEFLKLVVIALVIATPVAWWWNNSWLQKFSYRIDISIWFFIVAGCGAILLSLLTVGYQSIRAAMANPVKSLRSE